MHSGTDCPDVLMRQHGYTAIVRQYGDEGANFGVFPEPSAWLAKAYVSQATHHHQPVLTLLRP